MTPQEADGSRIDAGLERRCEDLRALHVSGRPLVLPNAWDAATARAVVEAGFPVVATTSGGVAAALGYEDHEGAPGEEMLAAAGRISRSVDVPVTVDAEAGYGMEPAQLVTALREIGAAGCNLEDTDHAAGGLREAEQQAGWLRAVREAARADRYPLVINARIDVFLSAFHSGSEQAQEDLLPDAIRRAAAYLEAGADCVFPIVLLEEGALGSFVSEVDGPVNALAIPAAPPLEKLAELGVARVSHGTMLHWASLERFAESLAPLASQAAAVGT